MKEINCACPLCEGNCDKCVCKLAESPGEHLISSKSSDNGY